MVVGQIAVAQALFDEEGAVDAAIRSGKTEFDWDECNDFDSDGEPRESMADMPEGSEPHCGAWKDAMPEHVRALAPEDQWEYDDPSRWPR
jgi:hypothetical protein